MGRRKRKNQKLAISIISAIVLIILGILGINYDQLTEETNQGKINVLSQNIANETINSAETNTTSALPVEGELEVYFIDVGQADSIFIRTGEEAMLIDAGNNGDGEDVVNFIKEKGTTKLDYVIGTHPHEDHIGGLDDVISSDLQIENVWLPKITTNTKTYEEVLDAIENKGLSVTSPKKGDTFQLGTAEAEVMTDSILDKNNLNLSSIVIRMQFGQNSFLFMGDSETENEETISWPKTDVLKVGHHGSDTSSSEEFLSQVKPTYSIIMVGKDNSYGLPKTEIIERLKNVGSIVYRTDEEGTIKLVSDGTTIAKES